MNPANHTMERKCKNYNPGVLNGYDYPGSCIMGIVDLVFNSVCPHGVQHAAYRGLKRRKNFKLGLPWLHMCMMHGLGKKYHMSQVGDFVMSSYNLRPFGRKQES